MLHRIHDSSCLGDWDCLFVCGPEGDDLDNPAELESTDFAGSEAVDDSAARQSSAVEAAGVVANYERAVAFLDEVAQRGKIEELSRFKTVVQAAAGAEPGKLVHVFGPEQAG